MRKSIDLLEQAIARDAGFTEAYCLLAKVNLFSYRFVSREPAHLRAGKAAAEKAMQLAPNLPESHIALARYYYLGLQDYERTYAELAQVTSPGNRSEYVDFLALTERRMGRWVDAVRHSEQAYELDPRNHFIAIALLESYLALRQYEQAIRFADRALTELPPDDDIIHIYKASALIGMGKLDEARMLLEQAPTRTPDGTAKLIQLAILARDLDRASELWATFPPARRFEVLYEGEIAELRGDTEKAHSFYRDARQHYLKLLEDNPDDRELTSFLSAAEAGLGNKAEAFRLARRAVELRPIFRDTYEAPAFALTRAEIYAWMGEGQAALDLLEELVTIPGSVSYGSLRFDPVWDDIRGDARFQALMARVTQPPVYR
ncbi:MAG: tetratricopeptide repeat protein [Chthoniobacterales bacterium]